MRYEKESFMWISKVDFIYNRLQSSLKEKRVPLSEFSKISFSSDEICVDGMVDLPSYLMSLRSELVKAIIFPYGVKSSLDYIYKYLGVDEESRITDSADSEQLWEHIKDKFKNKLSKNQWVLKDLEGSTRDYLDYLATSSEEIIVKDIESAKKHGWKEPIPDLSFDMFIKKTFILSIIFIIATYNNKITNVLSTLYVVPFFICFCIVGFGLRMCLDNFINWIKMKKSKKSVKELDGNKVL